MPHTSSPRRVQLRMMQACGHSCRGRLPGKGFAMSRSPILVALLALVVLSGGILPSWSVGAQEATPTPMTDHPLVGAWILDRDLTHPTNPQQLVVATSD